MTAEGGDPPAVAVRRRPRKRRTQSKCVLCKKLERLWKRVPDPLREACVLATMLLASVVALLLASWYGFAAGTWLTSQADRQLTETTKVMWAAVFAGGVTLASFARPALDALNAWVLSLADPGWKEKLPGRLLVASFMTFIFAAAFAMIVHGIAGPSATPYMSSLSIIGTPAVPAPEPIATGNASSILIVQTPAAIRVSSPIIVAQDTRIASDKDGALRVDVFFEREATGAAVDDPLSKDSSVEPIRQRDFLKAFGGWLSACVASDSADVPRTTPRAEIRGFASSSQSQRDSTCANERIAQNKVLKPAEAFNLCAAEARARHVRDALLAGVKSISGRPLVEIVPYQWKSFEEMTRAQAVSDAAEPGRMNLSRRAEIRITDLAGCRMNP